MWGDLILEILMDTRESDETKEILNLFLKPKEKMLLVGDIIVNNILCIEHKKIDDFINSIFDDRLFNQISKMKNNFVHSYIMVSGSMSDLLNLANDKNCYNSTKAAIASCFVRGCPVIFCDNLPNMCEIIKILGEKLTDGKNRTISVTKASIENDQLRLICSLPGISEKRGQALLDRFKSPMNIFNGFREDIIEINGIGDKTFNKMTEILNRNL